MKIKDFAVEQWMNQWETKCSINIAETCTESISLERLFELVGIDRQQWFDNFSKRRMSYGAIEGAEELLDAVAGLYKTVESSQIIPTHGAAGANSLLLGCLVNPGDHVVSIKPTYQQLYSIPEMCGAKVDVLHLQKEQSYHVDIEALDKFCSDGVDVICINNPDNPTGALLSVEELQGICDLAKKYDAWLVVDEVYRLLTQDGSYQESAADLYEKAVCTSSMSKVFSLAGIRLGWIVCKNADLKRKILSHRDYSIICCAQFDEAIAALALQHKDKLLARARNIVRNNLEVLDKWVREEEHVSYVRPEAGTTALVYYDVPVPSYEFCKGLLAETGALVTPGACFDEEYCMRIGYAYSEDSTGLTKGLQAISKYLNKLADHTA